MTVNWSNSTEKLERIRFNDQYLTHLDASMFTFMKYQLKELDLSQNRIQIVDLRHAIYLPKIMYLQRNKIFQFIAPINKDQTQTNMNELHLSHNGITNLNHNYFQFPQNLMKLELDYNDIRGVMNEQTVTKTIENTETLDLSYNNITIVNHDYLPEFTLLNRNLYLSQVKSKSAKLTHLYLYGNFRLKQINRGDFRLKQINRGDYSFTNERNAFLTLIFFSELKTYICLSFLIYLNLQNITILQLQLFLIY